MVQQHPQNRPIALAFGRVRIWRIKQGLGLVITKRWSLAFIGFDFRSFDPVHRVAARDCVALQQVIEQAGQRREFAADRGTGEAALFQLGAPG